MEYLFLSGEITKDTHVLESESGMGKGTVVETRARERPYYRQEVRELQDYPGCEEDRGRQGQCAVKRKAQVTSIPI